MNENLPRQSKSIELNKGLKTLGPGGVGSNIQTA